MTDTTPLPGAAPSGGFDAGPPQPHGRATGTRARGRGPGTAIAVVLGLVAFAAAAAGGFVAARAAADGTGPVACADIQCIRSVEADTVMSVLERRGFTCDDVACELAIGSTTYRAQVQSQENLISGYTLDVHHDPAGSLRAGGMDFLTWFAVLPFGDDPEAKDVAVAWVREQVGGDQEVTIRGYEYRLAAPEPGHVHLHMQAWPDPGNPFQEDGDGEGAPQ